MDFIQCQCCGKQLECGKIKATIHIILAIGRIVSLSNNVFIHKIVRCIQGEGRTIVFFRCYVCEKVKFLKLYHTCLKEGI